MEFSHRHAIICQYVGRFFLLILTLNRLNNPNVEYLSLRSNEIDDEKLASLCETLQNNTTLRFLELCDNLITKEG